MSESDFDFVERIYSSGLAHRVDKEGLQSLSRAEQSVALAWLAKGLLDNGGFQLLYGSPVSIDDVIDAFDEIGLQQAADVCRWSKTLFPDGGVPGDQTERRRLMERLGLTGSSSSNPFILGERQIWSMESTFDERVVQYVRAHPEKFERYLEHKPT